MKKLKVIFNPLKLTRDPEENRPLLSGKCANCSVEKVDVETQTTETFCQQGSPVSNKTVQVNFTPSRIPRFVTRRSNSAIEGSQNNRQSQYESEQTDESPEQTTTDLREFSLTPRTENEVENSQSIHKGDAMIEEKDMEIVRCHKELKQNENDNDKSEDLKSVKDTVLDDPDESLALKICSVKFGNSYLAPRSGIPKPFLCFERSKTFSIIDDDYEGSASKSRCDIPRSKSKTKHKKNSVERIDKFQISDNVIEIPQSRKGERTAKKDREEATFSEHEANRSEEIERDDSSAHHNSKSSLRGFACISGNSPPVTKKSVSDHQ